MDFLGTSKKIVKKVFGIQAYEDYKEAKRTCENAASKYKTALNHTETLRQELNEKLQSFADQRLESLTNVVGKFLQLLKDMDQKNKTSQYELLESIDVKAEHITELTNLHIS